MLIPFCSLLIALKKPNSGVLNRENAKKEYATCARCYVLDFCIFYFLLFTFCFSFLFFLRTRNREVFLFSACSLPVCSLLLCCVSLVHNVPKTHSFLSPSAVFDFLFFVFIFLTIFFFSQIHTHPMGSTLQCELSTSLTRFYILLPSLPSFARLRRKVRFRTVKVYSFQVVPDPSKVPGGDAA